MAQPYDRPARDPGGCECIHCDVIFIGEEWHTECAICHEKHERIFEFKFFDGQVLRGSGVDERALLRHNNARPKFQDVSPVTENPIKRPITPKPITK
jgi:hypothetical protein